MKTYKDPLVSSGYVSEPLVAYLTSQAGYSGPNLNVIQQARSGIKTGYLLHLGDLLTLSLQELSRILNVSLRTIQRYKPDFVLDADASSKVIQLSLLEKHGLEVFGDQSSFNDWLKSPLASLEGQTPLDYLDTPFGFQLIDQILGRIEHGIFA